jgi:hypothetical protein
VSNIAAKFKNRIKQKGANVDDCEEAIIEASTWCKRYGPDDLIYYFKDGTKIIKRTITGEWQ